jgi:biopolymer transport protein TolR
LRQISEINLTPLMDLTFLLLITFIITFPLIEQGIAVDLPKAAAADLPAEKARTITIDRESRVYLDEEQADLDTLRERLAVLHEADPNVRVLVRADERIPYGGVVKVLKVLHATGISKMALVTESDER